MLDPYLIRTRAILVAALLAALANGSISRAQDDEEDEPVQPPARRQRIQRVEEAWAFGMDRAKAQAMLEARLTMEIERIERTCRIAEVQKKKLQLAGRGDLKRFLDRVDEARRSLRAPRGDQKGVVAIQQEMEPLRRQLLQGLPHQSPIFAKTITRVLNDDQLAAYREGLRESRRFRHRARVDLVVEIFDHAAGCSDEQRQRLTKLFLQETRLPSKAEEEFLVVLAQAIRVPESEIKPIFDDSQWRPLSRLLKQLDGELKDQLGRVDFDPDDAAAPVAVRQEPTASGNNGPDPRP